MIPRCSLPDHAGESQLCFGCVKNLLVETRNAALEEAEKIVRDVGCRVADAPGEPVKRSIRHIDTDPYCPWNLADKVAALRGTG